MEGKRIGIVVGGAGAIPEAAIRMAQEHDVELVKVEDIKQEEYEPTRIPEQVYTIYPRPEIPDITPYMTYHEWVKVVRNTVVMKRESRRTGRKQESHESNNRISSLKHEKQISQNFR